MVIKGFDRLNSTLAKGVNDLGAEWLEEFGRAGLDIGGRVIMGL